VAANGAPGLQHGPAFCSICGNPLTAGSGFCPKCGNPVGGPAGALPPTPPPLFAGAAAPSVQTPAKKRHGPLYWVAVVIGIIVLIVIVLVIIAAVVFVSTTVSVSGINFTSSDNECGMNSQTALGFTTSGGASEQVSYIVTGGLFLSCTISSVTATTAGFSISGANVPLTVAADGSQTLTFTVHVPSHSYSGILTIDIE